MTVSLVKRAIEAIIVGAVATFAGATAVDDHTSRDDDGEIVESGGLGVLAIRVGDCIQLPDGSEALVASVEGVPCQEPHDAQVYAAFDLALDEYPGSRALEKLAFAGCRERWPDAVGTEWSTDRIHGLYVFSPTREGWRGFGDRGVQCLVVRNDGGRLTGDLL